MTSAALNRRVERVVGYPPLCEMGSDLAPTSTPAPSYRLLVVDDDREGGHG